MSESDDATRFAELFASLIEETFDAIVESQLTQADRRVRIFEGAEIPIDRFREAYISEDDVNQAVAAMWRVDDPLVALKQLFAGSAANKKAVAASLVELVDTAFADRPAEERDRLKARIDPGRPRVLKDALLKIRRMVADDLAAERQEQFRALAAEGVPRLVVDAGRVTAKARYHVTTRQAADLQPPAAGPARPTGRRRGPVSWTRPTVAIRPVGEADGEDSREMEIEFEMNFRTES